MKIAIIGHTGMCGRALTEELTRRGHLVTGLSAHGDKIPSSSGLTSKAVNIWDQTLLEETLAGQDVVISAFAAGHQLDDSIYYRQVEGTRRMIKAFRAVKGKYLIYIGGAASLYVKPGLQLFDDPRFPVWYYRTMPAAHLRWLADITGHKMFGEAAERRASGKVKLGEADPDLENFVIGWTRAPLLEGCRMALELFEPHRDFDWSFLSPPWLFRPGGKGTGSYQLGVDFMLLNNGMPTGISLPDLALAVADEAERKALVHKHWTLAGAQDDC